VQGSAGTGTPDTAGTAAPIPMGMAGIDSPVPMAGEGGAAGSAPPPAGAGGASAPMDPSTPSGPEDGDPSQPVVAISGIPCGPNRSLFGLTSTNATIGGRQVHVAYPCNKRKGAPMVFILNLHGTMPDEGLKLYQVAYFAANNLVDSHNFITVAPKSVVSQWGNGDNGRDEPHLMEVIEWVYRTFSDFDIRSMWVGGHSWGSAYTARFGCKAELADKVRGLVLMSGGGIGGAGGPSCSNRVSALVSMAEGDGRMPSDQTALATAHGCSAAQRSTILMNDVTVWPNCDSNYVHANYYMRGKQHATYMDAEVVRHIGDLIKQSRP
jgi:pimeloyl-ACP methyl ester carboxylesterase